MKRKSKLKEINIQHQTVAQYVNEARKFPRIRLFFWLLRCSDALEKYAISVMEKGDTRTLLAVLQVLLKYPDGVSQQIIAKQTGLTKQAIVVAIDNLVKKGHVIRNANEYDRRTNSIKITQKGLEHLSKVFPYTVKMCNEALSSLSDSEIDELLCLVIKQTKNLWGKIESESK